MGFSKGNGILKFLNISPRCIYRRRQWHPTPVLWTGEPGRLQSMGSLRVGHDWATSLSLFTLMHWRRKWQPTPVLLPRESQAPPPLGFSRQEYWSWLPFPSPMHESEKWKWSCSVVSDSSRPHGLQPTRLLCPWDFPGKNTGVGSHSLLQEIFLTQGSNPGLLHCRQILYHLIQSWVSNI